MTKIIFTLSFLILTPLTTSASILDNMNEAGNAGGYDQETDEKTMSEIVGVVINAFLSLLGVIFVSLIVYGGSLWMTDAGNNEKVQKAKQLIGNAIIGLIITASAWAFWLFIFKKIILGD